MIKEKIIVCEDEHNIEVKPITLVYNKQHLKIDYPERVMISSFDSLNHFKDIEEIDKYTASLFKIVVFDFREEITKKSLNRCGTGHQHLIGLFSLTFKLISENIKFGWRYPESFLHPSTQLELANATIILSNPKIFSKFIDCVHNNKFDSYLKKGGGDLRSYFFNVICNEHLKNFIKDK